MTEHDGRDLAAALDPAQHPPRPFPDDDWAWFAGRCVALGIGDPAPKRQRLEAIFGHLMGVNAWLNLTRIDSPRDYLKLHVLDSLTGLTDRRLQHLSEGDRCVDLGSGGGYPGLPLALWQPQHRWTLIDSRSKKAAFLAAALTLIPEARFAEARHLRAREAASPANDLHFGCQLVVARAVGQAVDLLEESAPLIHHHGHLVIYKGPAYAGPEQATAEKAAKRLGFRPVGITRLRLEDTDPERLLVVFEKL